MNYEAPIRNPKNAQIKKPEKKKKKSKSNTDYQPITEFDKHQSRCHYNMINRYCWTLVKPKSPEFLLIYHFCNFVKAKSWVTVVYFALPLRTSRNIHSFHINVACV